ncbi:MAG: CusA/CzcA family heavy metal efflux RND transporter [Kofleriaceae bacterium]|nr:CusA/CzcA family heavy metal efflux RND transporter [Kofleriaceae bacterium]
MLESIIRWSVANRIIVILLSLVLVAGGLTAMQRLPIDAVPDVTNVQVQVLTKAPALGPEEVEKFITTPIELAMSGLPGLEEVRSTSKFGLSAVTVVFEDGTDIYFARQLINERLQQAREAIPEGYGDPEMGPISTGLGEIYQFEVRGDGKTPMELRSILEWDIAPRLRTVPGVIEINAFGGELKTYEVQVRPEDLVRHDISIGDVVEAVERNNANAGGAYIERAGEQYLVRGEGLITTLEDISDIVIANDSDGTPIFIRNIADVRFAPMVRQGAVTRDGRGEVVTGIAMMLMGANSRAVVNDLKAEVERLRPSLAKQGVTIEAFYDRTELVSKTIRTVATNLIEGGLLVIVILFLMLRNLRAGLVVASVIPLSMLFAFIGMNRLGVSGNLMSLGALDFGLIVDGAVILIENSIRLIAEKSHHLGRPLTREERASTVVEASAEVRRATLFGVLIISIVYLPILALIGIEGKMFQPMAITVLLALGGAMILAFTFVPALASMLLPRKMAEKDSFLVAGARKVYDPALRRSMRHPRITALLALVTLAGAGLLATRLGAEFVPTLDEGAIALQAWRPPSVSLEESIRQTTELEKTLKEFPEVTTVVSKTGRAEIATDPMGVEISDVFVMLKPRDEWTTADDREELVAKFDARLRSRLPGTIFSYSQPIELRVAELISGVRSEVAVKVFGDDMATLNRTAAKVVAVLSKVPGAAEVKAEQTAGLPVLRVIVDRRAIARYGLNAADVLDVISTLGGREVGVVLEGSRRFALQVRFSPETRASVEVVKRLLVRAPNGERVPLEQIADVRVEDGPAQISHEQGRRRVTVELNVRGRDLASFVADAEEALAQADVVPAGYFVDWGGQFENLAAASKRLLVVIPLALGLILVLLYMSFHHIGIGLLIYLNVPFATIGGIVALAIRGLPLSISAGVGFIALFGVAVLNGLVLMGTVQQRRAAGATAARAAFEVAHLRLRPVLTTALVASLGFVPMALATGAGAEVQRPLATVVIGGILTSTVLTLLVLPTVYAWLFGRNDAPAERIGTFVSTDATSSAESGPVEEPKL